MATNEIKRITEILWEQMKINDEADKKNSTLTSSRGNNKNNVNDYSVAREFANLHSVAANKKKSKSNRDSLAFRDSPGKPGTKRFNRYLNTQFLKTAGSLGGNGNGDIEMDYSFYEQRNTLFYQDQQNSKYYHDNYVNISCDQEQEILNSCLTPSKKSNLRKKNTSVSGSSGNSTEDNELFSKLKKNLRPFFKKSFLLDSQFIQETEREILSFIRGDDCSHGTTPINTKEFNQDNPSKRLIIHGLASYYSLQSRSHTNTNNGQRILVLRKPRSMPSLPEQSIVQYLIAESKKQAIQIHQVQRKKVIKKSQSIYIKKRVLTTPVVISADIPNSDD